jgi:hypothetical protein
MAEARVERRLAAILAADVAGYSRMMGQDEAGTLAALKTQRSELIEPTIAKYNGRVVKLMGDGILAEFGSVVEAVLCATQIQREMALHPTGKRMQLRIGLHVGDIITDGEDILRGWREHRRASGGDRGTRRYLHLAAGVRSGRRQAAFQLATAGATNIEEHPEARRRLFR